MPPLSNTCQEFTLGFVLIMHSYLSVYTQLCFRVVIHATFIFCNIASALIFPFIRSSVGCIVSSGWKWFGAPVLIVGLFRDRRREFFLSDLLCKWKRVWSFPTGVRKTVASYRRMAKSWASCKAQKKQHIKIFTLSVKKISMKQVLEPYFWNLIHTTERECEMTGKLTAVCETLADLRFFLSVCCRSVSLAGNQQSSGRSLCSVWFILV